MFEVLSSDDNTHHIFFLLASIPIFNAVKSLNLCTDSRNIKLEWNATVPSHNYIIKYRKLGDLLEVSRKTENTTTEVLTCLQPNTTYRVIVEIESRPNAYKFDNPKPFEFTTGEHMRGSKNLFSLPRPCASKKDQNTRSA